jgi:GNAT superfamily N-acetyltransferase
MYWIRKRSVFEKQKGSGNKRTLKRMVAAAAAVDEGLGLIAYAGRDPVGWCALGPRERYSVLERSRILKPVDEKPVWSVVCFFVAKPFRRSGVTVALLEAAVKYAKKHRARILEGYPVEPKKIPMPAAFAWTGLAAAFRKAGFTEVLRRSETRPIMRYKIR